jgi:hypothetical protein
MLECPTPPDKPATPKHPTFGLLPEHEIPITVNLDDFAWLLSRTLVTQQASDGTQEESNEERAQVPVWSGYNSNSQESTSCNTWVHLPYWHTRHMSGTLSLQF